MLYDEGGSAMIKEQFLKSVENYWKQREALIVCEDDLKQYERDVYVRFCELRQMRYPKSKIPGIDYIEFIFCAEIIRLKWEEYCCGDTDHYEEEFPTNYLFDDNWKERESTRLAEIKKQNEELAAQQEIKKAEEQRERDLKLFEHLKTKLGK